MQETHINHRVDVRFEEPETFITKTCDAAHGIDLPDEAYILVEHVRGVPVRARRVVPETFESVEARLREERQPARWARVARRWSAKHAAAALVAALLAVVCAPARATPPAPQVTSCTTICGGQGEGTCCFEKCVCDTDPDPEARKEHCGKWRDLGCDRPSTASGR